MIPPTLYLIFSSGTIAIAKAPADSAALLDAGLIQTVMVGKTLCYCIAKSGYEKVVRL